jgi:hypothetical protein
MRLSRAVAWKDFQIADCSGLRAAGHLFVVCVSRKIIIRQGKNPRSVLVVSDFVLQDRDPSIVRESGPAAWFSARNTGTPIHISSLQKPSSSISGSNDRKNTSLAWQDGHLLVG